LHCAGVRVDAGNNHFDFEADQIVGQLVQPLRHSIREAILDQHIAANDVPAFG